MSENRLYPGWRSLLFIPVHIDKFVDKAHTRGADGYILDLEDSVPLAEKAYARGKVRDAAQKVSCQGAAALVRINLDWSLAQQDIDSSVCEQVSALVLPKVEHPDQILRVAELIERQEQAQNLPQGHTAIIAMIESVEALPHLDAIARAHSRMMGVTLGSEDFSVSAGMLPQPATLFHPNQMIVFACRRAGIEPLGFPGSIADYSDMDAFHSTITQARNMGFVGALCIHPKQAEVLNAIFTPSDHELDNAQGLIAAFEEGLSAGKGAVEFKGKMIDLPVVNAAKKLIHRAEKLGIRKA